MTPSDTDPHGLKLGQLAVARGLLSPDALARCLDQQLRQAAEGRIKHLGDVLVEQELLDRDQLSRLIRIQQRERGASAVGAGSSEEADADTTRLEARGGLSFPHRLGPYQLFETLGAGGMGTVYRARHTGLDRVVALKLLTLDDDGASAALERFRREARIIAQLDHPGIVRVLDMGEDEGRAYIAMELVEGRDLAVLLKTQRLAWQKILPLMVDIAAAVGHVHQRGFIHRDLKPSNILIDRDGRPRVTDFGLGRALGSRSRLTQTRQIVGTLQYLAPENLQDETRRHVGPAADVFGLGVILYEMIAGEPPFVGETPMELIRNIVEADSLPLRRIQPDLPRDVETVCLKALCKDPAQRYLDAQEMAADLKRAMQGQAVLARPESWWSRGRRGLERHRTLSIAALLLVVAATGGAAWMGYVQRRLARASHRQAVLALADADIAGQRYAAAVSRLDGLLRTDPRAREDLQVSARLATAQEQIRRLPERLQAAVAEMVAETTLLPDGEGALHVPPQNVQDRHTQKLLGRRSPLLVQVLTPELRHARASVRWLAAKILGEAEDPSAVPALLRQLEEEQDSCVELAIADAAARLAPREASVRQALFDALDRYDHPPQSQMVGALSRLQLEADDPTAYGAEDWCRLGIYFRIRKDLSKAALAFEQAVELAPSDPRVLIAHVELLLDSGRHPGALEGLDRVLSLRGLAARLRSRALIVRARLYFSQVPSLPQQALADLDAAAALSPQACGPLHIRSLVRLGLDFTRIDHDDFDQAIALHPHHALHHFSRGMARLKVFNDANLGRWMLLWTPEEREQLATAIADLDRAIDLDAGAWDYFFLRGRAHLLARHHPDALEDFDRAALLAPDEADPYAWRAQAHQALRRSDAALTDFNRALQLNPDHIMALDYRGALYLDRDQLEAAIADFDRAIAISPEQSRLYQQRALAHLKQQDYPRALDDCNASFQLAPSNPMGLQVLYNMYVQQGQFRGAWQAMTRLIEVTQGLEGWDHQGLQASLDWARQRMEEAEQAKSSSQP